MPQIREREDILRLHTKGKPLSKDVSLSSLASLTAFFSGASLENLINEAAIRAARRNAREIGQKDIDEAFVSVTAGEDGKAHENSDEKTVIAVHEAGHALVTRALYGSAIQRISILPSSGGAAGYNLLLPEDKSLFTKADMEKKILVLLAGRCAEQIVFSSDGITSGASGDIRRAGEIAANCAGELGFSEHPAIHENTFMKAFGARFDPSEKARAMLSELYNENLSFLSQNLETLIKLSNELLAKESMDKSEIDRFFALHPVSVSKESADSAKEDAV